MVGFTPLHLKRLNFLMANHMKAFDYPRIFIIKMLLRKLTRELTGHYKQLLIN